MSAATASTASAPHHGDASSVHAHVAQLGRHHHSDPDDHDDHDVHHGKSEEMDAEHELDELGGNDQKPRKKRRVVKTSDKKFDCPQPDCGKSYSRAEHLYRHQLNPPDTPKQIYHCDFPGCDRQFVRADLCARHKERHTAKGSHLQRKDAYLNTQRAAAAAAAAAAVGNGSHARAVAGSGSPPDTKVPLDANHAMPPLSSSRPTDGYAPQSAMLQPLPSGTDAYQSHHMSDMAALHADSAGPLDPQLAGNTAHYSSFAGSGSSSNNFSANPPMMPPPPQSPSTAGRYSYDPTVARPPSVNGAYPPQHQSGMSAAMHPPQLSPQQSGSGVYAQQQYTSPTSNGGGSGQQFRTPAAYSHMSVVTSFGMPQDYGMPTGASRSAGVLSPPPPTMGAADQFQMPGSRPNGLTDFNVFDQYTGFAMPVFGHDYFNRSPPTAIDDALFNQLLENSGLDLAGPSPPPTAPMQIPQSQVLNSSSNIDNAPVTTPAIKSETESLPSNEPVAHTPTSNSLDINRPESNINVRRQTRMATLLQSFEDIDGPSGRKLKHDVVSGDTNHPSHPLSVHMLKTYLASYWLNIHQQMPILHRPTFNPETCPDLLLLAMICLGASCLERKDMPELLSRSADMAYFTAYHIRWEVFKDVEFRPTAKLWTFQTMLLLELYEKMYSTRTLHERAHIHHATTLTVMRRGSSLVGRSAVESPSSSNDPTRTPPGPDGSINTSGQNTPDAFWNRWITNEATRRVAFAAFVIDSTHATLFGHSAVMAPHDIRLPLPCDEALWSATSSAEVQRVEASLAANGFKPTTFLDGLKKTLNGQKVRTNTFGRVILMAGLLSVSWHMNQRDLQVSSLGASNTLGNPIRWRSPLTRAFDFWRRDFDDSLSKSDHWLRVCPAKDTCSIDHRETVFESRTCLHSLAHMAMHVDIVDCEVFAGSDRALGRIVTDTDRVGVQRRMREGWAPSARARDATFYALRFLCEVLIPDDDPHPSSGLGNNHSTSGTNSSNSSTREAKLSHSPDLDSPQQQPQHHRHHNRHQHQAPTLPPPAEPTSPPDFRYSARDDYLLNRPYILYFASMIIWSYGYALDGPLRQTNSSTPSTAYRHQKQETHTVHQGHSLVTRELQAADMQQYLMRMGRVASPEDLEHVSDRNACLGLLLLLKDCFQQPRWELLHEASDMLGRCIDLLVPGSNASPAASANASTAVATNDAGQYARYPSAANGASPA